VFFHQGNFGPQRRATGRNHQSTGTAADDGYIEFGSGHAALPLNCVVVAWINK
jgi:hypothetical protein